MGSIRSYHDGCGAAHALDLVGERWALLVIRELLLGPKRFTDLRAGLPGVSSNVLSQRLQELEQAQILGRHRLPPPASAWVYELTPWGYRLETTILELGRWGASSPWLNRTAPMSADSLVLSFRTLFRPPRKPFRADVELRLGDDRFHARVDGGRFEVARGIAPAPAAAVDTTPDVLARIVYDGHDLGKAMKQGRLTVHGDTKVAQNFLALFARPSTAPAAPAGRS